MACLLIRPRQMRHMSRPQKLIFRKLDIQDSGLFVKKTQWINVWWYSHKFESIWEHSHLLYSMIRCVSVDQDIDVLTVQHILLWEECLCLVRSKAYGRSTHKIPYPVTLCQSVLKTLYVSMPRSRVHFWNSCVIKSYFILKHHKSLGCVIPVGSNLVTTP